MAWITISSLQRATDTWCCLSRNFLNINTPSAVDMHHQSGGAYLTDRTIRDHSYDWILYSTLLYIDGGEGIENFISSPVRDMLQSCTPN